MDPKEIDFGSLEWERTPYKGVFLSYIDKAVDPTSSRSTLSANVVKIDPDCEIGLHYHDREEDWTEFVVFFPSGPFEAFSGNRQRSFSGSMPVYMRVGSREAYRIKNKDPHKPLFLISIMKPGFSGYEEIKDC